MERPLASALRAREPTRQLRSASRRCLSRGHPLRHWVLLTRSSGHARDAGVPVRVFRNRFTELGICRTDDDTDLAHLVSHYLAASQSARQVAGIVRFYRRVRLAADSTLCDGFRPASALSLRKPLRALREARRDAYRNAPDRCYEGFCFRLLGPAGKRLLWPRRPGHDDAGTQTAPVATSWLRTIGSARPFAASHSARYVLTALYQKRISVCLARIVSAGSLPVLIQGETSRARSCKRWPRGSWIVLDELNLAASDVLEALNRVLDDNRHNRAHPHFMLFATQNPPGLYGGRKRLSRALRNRFVELHFSTIPRPELELILQRRCDLPFCEAQADGIFQGKDGFVTLRDLFDGLSGIGCLLCQTLFDWDQFLAEQGLPAPSRSGPRSNDAADVQSVLESVFRRRLSESETTVALLWLMMLMLVMMKASHQQLALDSRIAPAVRAALATVRNSASRALLIGPKALARLRVCQAWLKCGRQDLLTLNCHMNTEAADFLGSLSLSGSGGLTPRRSNNRSRPGDAPRRRLLVDEISLADDSVLERLNSVLEPERELVLAERSRTGDGGNTVEVLKALPEFRLVATMTLAAISAKKELSPALRNRFTEIGLAHLAKPMADLLTEAAKAAPTDDGRLTVSARTALVWVAFVRSVGQADRLPAELAFLHGYQMTCLDPLGTPLTKSVTTRLLSEAVAQLRSCCSSAGLYTANRLRLKLSDRLLSQPSLAPRIPADAGLQPVGAHPQRQIVVDYCEPFNCPAAGLVLPGRLARSRHKDQPSGSALAKASGHRLSSINLSTPRAHRVADLFGQRLPKEVIRFAGHSGRLLRVSAAGPIGRGRTRIFARQNSGREGAVGKCLRGSFVNQVVQVP
uniref:Midasin n=1 Tax=Macrostomum lignano TaxID=282301 RepID=A0A1I8FCL4_9PLAT